MLDVARAGSSWLTSRADLDASARDEQDQNVLREQYPDKYQKALDGAASLIQSDEARQKFLLSNQIHVKQAQIAASARADDLHRDAFTADVYRQSNGLLTAGLKAPDDATRASIIAQHGKLIDGMAENGYISRAAAEKQKNDWANSFSQSALSMMPAGQRLVALGAARDPLSVAKAFVGATEDSHADVLTDFFRKTGGQAIDPREVAWCAAFADAVLGAAGKEQAHTLRAADFLNYGTATASPSKGDVVVFKSLAAGSSGHVGFVVAVEGDRVRYVAGNDSGAVQESTLPLSKVAGFRVPPAAGTPVQGLNATAPEATRVVADLDRANPRSGWTDILRPDQVASLADGARREFDHQRRNDSAVLKSQIADDTSSIMATGQPVRDLTPERVGATMGAAAQADFVDTRQRAQAFYSQTSDFDTLPSAQIAQRLESLKPKAGEVGFEKQQGFYDAAAKRAAEVVKLRQTDPAASVAKSPAIQQALQAVDQKQPETWGPLVKARIAAQEAAGIPAGQQQPLTREEASRLMAPVVNALAGTERQALQQIVPYFQKAFGGQADRALQFAIEQAKVDTDTAAAAASMFKKIGLGQKPTQTDHQTLSTAQTNDAMARAAGTIAGQAIGDAFNAQPPAAQPTQRSDVRPPSEAIKALIQNPGRADEFDALFGKGMAARVMKEYGTMTKGVTPNG